MTVKIDSDDRSVISVNQRSLEKVGPVLRSSSTLHHQKNGNYSPVNAANSDQGAAFQEVLGSKNMDKVIDEINANVQVIQRELHFSVDEDSGHTIVKVMDMSTKEVIRQIPNEEALKFARKLNEGVELQLINEYG